MFAAVVEELRDRGCHVLAHDLYAEGFAPALTADETETVQSATSARDVQVELHRSEVATPDTPADREESEFGDPLQRIWAACVLPYVGVADVRRIAFRTVTDSAEELRASWLRQARQQAAALMV